MVRSRRCQGLLLGLLLLVVAVLASLVVGSRSIGVAQVFEALSAYDRLDDQHLIVRELRVPRTLVAILAGLALGLAGAIMQAVTRNPLAEPGLLGINAGAGVGVIVGVAVLGLSSMSGYVWCAFVGAGLAGVAVFMLGRAQETGTNPVRLVLAGAGLSVMLASVTGIIILNAPAQVFDQFRHWASGSLERAASRQWGCWRWPWCRALSRCWRWPAASMPWPWARTWAWRWGVNVRLTWLLACLAVMLLAGAATAAAGPIGFVGLVAPHLARLLVGPDYRWILPYSALFAGVLLLGADVLGRVVAAPAEVAAGIVALLIGGPFFIALVRTFRLSKL